VLDGLEFAQPFSAFVTTDFQAFAGGSSYRAPVHSLVSVAGLEPEARSGDREASCHKTMAYLA
jgi:hypothetical protein